MRTKRRGGGKRERFAVAGIDAFPGVFVVCCGDFDCVRVPGTAAPQRPREIHRVVPAVVSPGWDRDRLGDVSVF